jgi:hypothetical protein
MKTPDCNPKREGGVLSSALFGSLENDITRCDGTGSVEDGVQCWRDGCETCLRRTATRPERVSIMSPPVIIAFECEYLIEPNAADHRQTPTKILKAPKL